MTSILCHDVRAEDRPAYDTWLHEIGAAAARFPGHRAVTVVRPVSGATLYILVLHFDALDNLRTWLNSEDRRRLIAKAQPLLLDGVDAATAPDLDARPAPPVNAKTAPAYKQFLVTLSVIYPLTTLIPLLLDGVFGRLGLGGAGFVRLLAADATIVALMTYVIMPPYTRLIGRWLYAPRVTR